MEVYKCITDISKTSYPFHRARISSKVFTTDSGVPYLLRPFEVLFTRLELKQKMDKMILYRKECVSEQENCRGPHLLGKKEDPQALECEVRVQDRTKYFMEKHGN